MHGRKPILIYPLSSHCIFLQAIDGGDLLELALLSDGVCLVNGVHLLRYVVRRGLIKHSGYDLFEVF